MELLGYIVLAAAACAVATTAVLVFYCGLIRLLLPAVRAWDRLTRAIGYVHDLGRIALMLVLLLPMGWAGLRLLEMSSLTVSGALALGGAGGLLLSGLLLTDDNRPYRPLWKLWPRFGQLIFRLERPKLTRETIAKDLLFAACTPRVRRSPAVRPTLEAADELPIWSHLVLDADLYEVRDLFLRLADEAPRQAARALERGGVELVDQLTTTDLLPLLTSDDAWVRDRALRATGRASASSMDHLSLRGLQLSPAV